MTLRRSKVLKGKRIISTALGTMLLCIPSIAQTKSPQIVQQAKTATCSNVVVTGGSAVFKCSGLTKEQTKLMRDVPALLTRLLKSQELDTTEILSRLDTCIAQGAARDLSPKIQSDLKDKLRLPFPGLYSITLRISNITPESSRYAVQMLNAFHAAGWEVNPIQDWVTNDFSSGLTIVANDRKSPPGIMIRQAFNVLGIKANYVLDPRLDPKTIDIWVGQKPIE